MYMNQQQTDIPKGKKKDIFPLLFKFRYLSRIHVQKLLHHKSWKLIIEWLNELAEEKYIYKFYNRSFAGVPAVYCLDTRSRTYLKTVIDKSQFPLLDRIYKEKKLSETLKNQSLLIADIYLSLQDLANENSYKLSFLTKTNLYNKDFLLTPHPDAYIALQESKTATKRYFLDVINPMTPYKKLNKRIENYAAYFESNDWEDTTSHPFPKVIFVCPDERAKKHIFKHTQRILESTPDDFSVFVTTWADIKVKGMNGEILERVET